MFRRGLCLFVLFCVVDIISARHGTPIKCRVVQRECGRRTCTVKQQCCRNINGTRNCHNETKRAFHCLNGGKHVSLLGRNVCRCSVGFSGTRCQKKEGTCPAFPEIARLPCNNDTCETDADCQGHQKCCDKYCSRVCVDPIPTDPCASVKCGNGTVCKIIIIVICKKAPCSSLAKCVPIEKEGVCPFFGEMALPPCGNDTCKTDADCPGQQKCCDRYCSRVCVNPAPEKEGKCPAFIEIALLPCGNDTCKTDADCQGDQKCCEKFCSHHCVDPIPVDPCESVKCDKGKVCKTVSVECNRTSRPSQTQCVPKDKQGKCPVLPEIGLLPCGNDTCKTDADCEGDQKCCEKFCSHHCLDPIPVDPCESVKCDKGKVCKTVSVECNRTSCPPQTQCVSKVKQGKCPAFLEIAHLPCGNDTCRTDVDCQGQQKCCDKFCSHHCVNPRSGSDPCIAATCLVNQKCIARDGKAQCIPITKSKTG